MAIPPTIHFQFRPSLFFLPLCDSFGGSFSGFLRSFADEEDAADRERFSSSERTRWIGTRMPRSEWLAAAFDGVFLAGSSSFGTSRMERLLDGRMSCTIFLGAMIFKRNQISELENRRNASTLISILFSISIFFIHHHYITVSVPMAMPRHTYRRKDRPRPTARI